MFGKQLVLCIFFIVLILEQLLSGYCASRFSDDYDETNNDLEVEEDILRLMGFLDQPKNPHQVPIRNRSAPEFLKSVYEYFSQSENNQYSFSSERSKRASENSMLTERDYRLIDESDVMISFVAQKSRADIGKPDDVSRMNFDVSAVPSNEIPTHGELRLYRGSSINDTLKNYDFTITAYQLSSLSSGTKVKHFINSVNVTANYEGWIILNITKTLHDWIKNRRDNNGIRIIVEICHSSFTTEMKPEAIGIVGFDGDPAKHAFMVAYYRHDEKKSIQLNIRNITNKLRQKRSVTLEKKLRDKLLSFSEDDSPYPCAIVDYYVRFKDINFNQWIIAPEGFSVGYCSGECTLSAGLNIDNSNHAIVQAVLHSVYPKQIPPPCCVPIKLSPMSVLYFANNDQVVLKKYNDMILDKCGCR
ncbi:hypothetical protein PV327_007935 [Microctonus hyperodae]|uniref:TGF-beta family profile domain-containing protein n=1 Tax=Microctonus hyperodae TaxID=165561 RepID=A0AA39G0J6_MICHY|nr:hypothetical protein PV327_007935 [Microctonus hyperodae]